VNTLADLVALGYTVDTQGDLTAVRGLGVATVIETGDQAAIDSLWNAVTHAAGPTIATAGDTTADAAVIINGNLAAAKVAPAAVPTILAGLLTQAQAAIPYYEGLTGSPDATTAWTNFQALPQATKDRVVYNCCRTHAALIRYLTGSLA
jgi:hypothetical protein